MSRADPSARARLQLAGETQLPRGGTVPRVIRIGAPLGALVSAATLAVAGPAVAEPAAAPPEGRQAKVCFTCHKTVEPGTIRGHFDEYAEKARSIQLKVDGEAVVLSFDPARLEVRNATEAGGAEKALKAVKKGAEVSAVYALDGNVKRLGVLVLKPRLKVAPEKQVSTAEMEKLVAAGPAKGKYFLFDARPAPRYAEGHIPTAESLPFPAFEKEKGKLPADTSALVIFYCSGVT
jgi:hypothetical protein